MDTALILHWWEGNSEENWFPWLQKQLNNKFLDVYTPNLPHTNFPVFEEQMEYINVYSSSFKEWWYIIGHSLWCQLALKFIEENNIKNSVIILVAPVYCWLADEMWESTIWEAYSCLKTYVNNWVDFEKINKLNNKFHVFLSDNDSYINIENAKNYLKELKNTDFRILKNKWHFNQASWITELEEIMEYIESSIL